MPKDLFRDISQEKVVNRTEIDDKVPVVEEISDALISYTTDSLISHNTFLQNVLNTKEFQIHQIESDEEGVVAHESKISC